MKSLDFSRYAFSYIAVAMLAGCGALRQPFDSARGDMQPPIGAPSATPQSRALARTGTLANHVLPAWSYRVLYGFENYTNGASPVAGLVEVNGTFYGTTSEGGDQCGCGTIYSVTSAGVETALYHFAGGSDGAHPFAGLINVNGTLYGTTSEGGGSGCGGSGCGTIYSVTTSGVETVLYRFAGGSDGEGPSAGLIDVNGTLYGTTVFGGPGGRGTVYSVTTGGVETVLHSFPGGGAYPFGGLIDANGTLYGTTGAGGAYSRGTVFSITTAGVETVLYSFGAQRSDGAHPQAGLIEVNGRLYGTTEEGGRSNCANGRGCGTVYSVTTAGVESVLHHFHGTAGGSDGERPLSVLLNMRGRLYGTTYYGGARNYGIVFSVNLKGREHVLYSFLGCSNGSNPQAPLIKVEGTLYGAALWGGGNCSGYGRGAIFALSP
jgi:uncharacterized repeat protein (TIGR03803 family)